MKAESGRISKTAKILLPIILILSCCAFGCPRIRITFSSGIRVETYEALRRAPGAKLPVPFVRNNGDLLRRLGPGSGTETDYQGTTNRNGVSEYPSAVTNAEWSMFVDYRGRIPRCGTARRGTVVPPEGLIFQWTCFTGF
jgi:hypothetical protein